MIDPVGMLAGLRRVALVALAETPMMVILVVAVPWLTVQLFLPGGLVRLQKVIDMVHTYMISVLKATADQGRASLGRGRGRDAGR